MSHTRYPTTLRATETRYASPSSRVRERDARSFYGGVLGGIEVRPADRVDSADALYFLVEDQLVEAGALGDAEHAALELTVESPLELAERCWNAGYSVRFDGDGDDAILQLMDPYGRSIALLPRDGAGN